jgi:signal transduction histidine kinase
MTIKRRLFISNIILLVVIAAGFMLFGSVIRYIVRETLRNNSPNLFTVLNTENDFEKMMTIDSSFLRSFSIAFLALAAFIVITNIIITRRMIRNIIMPLNILSIGAAQIRDSNLSFRIEYTKDDEFRLCCTTFNDMAARLETMIRAREKDENARRELIAGMSHDLRTPLTSIKAYLEGLEKGVADTPEKQKKYMDTIRSKTNDLEKIINQLFLFSKLDLKEFPMNIQTITTENIIQGLYDDYAEEYQHKGLAIITGTVTNEIVTADISWIRTVFVNILENSAKYKTKSTGTIVISSNHINRPSGRMAEIHLLDDGPGVPPETLDRLFDVFYQVDSSRSNRGKQGSGLGLAISARLLRHMGGTIRAELGSAGGLNIVISLPLAAGK